MAKNQPTPKTLDEEVAEVKKLNEGFVDPDPEIPPTPPEPLKEPAKEPPKEPTPPAEPTPPTPPTPPAPPTPPTPVPPEPEPPVPPVSPEPPAPRPHKYIPIAQYTAEKKAQKEREDALREELEALKETTKKDSPKEEEEIKAYAEKYGVEEEFIKGILAMARRGLEIPKESLEKLDKADGIIKAQEEMEYFKTEWEKFSPELKKAFPNATLEQLTQASALMDKISHTPAYAAYNLDYVFFKERSQFDPLFAAPTPAQEAKPGIELSRIGGGGPKQLTVADFKDEKDFEKLKDLSEEEKTKLTSQFEPSLYDKYMRWEAYVANSNGLEVKREGRKITLK